MRIHGSTSLQALRRLVFEFFLVRAVCALGVGVWGEDRLSPTWRCPIGWVSAKRKGSRGSPLPLPPQPERPNGSTAARAEALRRGQRSPGWRRLIVGEEGLSKPCAYERTLSAGCKSLSGGRSPPVTKSNCAVEGKPKAGWGATGGE